MALPFVSNETSNWLLYILTDSALPTGGFVASSGLEATYQAGLLTASSLPDFVTDASESYAWTTVCFVKAGYEAAGNADPIASLVESDNVCDAVMAANAVGRRASLAQGVAMLTLYLKCFTEEGLALDPGVVKRFKNMVRAEQVNGHFPICFGLVCRYLNVDLGKNEKKVAPDNISCLTALRFYRLENTLHLWLYLFARTLYSSAVRLNIIGPYEAQKLLLRSREPIEGIIRKTRDMTIDDCCQINPLLDVCQGMHDRLYTRLFNS